MTSERGVARPDLLETMRYCERDGVRNLSRHLERMADSARELGYRFDSAAVVAEVQKFVRSASGVRRVRVTSSATGVVHLISSSFDLDAACGPVHLEVCSTVARSTDAAARHKTVDRRRYDLARLRHPAADDVVLVDELGEVSETTIANIVFRRGTSWVTPASSSGCLPGIERARLLDVGAIVEGVVDIEELLCATEVGVVSSLRGFRRAVIGGARSGDGMRLPLTDRRSETTVIGN